MVTFGEGKWISMGVGGEMYLVGWLSHWPLTILIYRFCLIVYPGFGGVWCLAQQIYSDHRASVWCLDVWWQCLGTRIASLFFHCNTPSFTVIICTQSDLSSYSSCFLATRQYHPAVCLRFPGLDSCSQMFLCDRETIDATLDERWERWCDASCLIVALGGICRGKEAVTVPAGWYLWCFFGGYTFIS